jgi:hypothetical protein
MVMGRGNPKRRELLPQSTVLANTEPVLLYSGEWYLTPEGVEVRATEFDNREEDGKHYWDLSSKEGDRTRSIIACDDGRVLAFVVGTDAADDLVLLRWTTADLVPLIEI